MKYDYPSYYFYQVGSLTHFAIQAQVNLKEPVDIAVLRNAVNAAMTRYPYFCKKLTVNAEGAYVLTDNPNPVAVLPAGKKPPKLCSKEVHEHLLFVECSGSSIDFHISHALAGGKGMQPWILTCIYLYLKERCGVELQAPAIRKPGEPLLPGEDSCPTLDSLTTEKPLFTFQPKGAHMMVLDYLNGLFNPIVKSEVFWGFRFHQADILRFAKRNDLSVNSLFIVLMAKAMDRLLPSKIPFIGAETAHNPCADVGLPNAAVNMLTHAHVTFSRDMFQWDMERLGTATRTQVILQTDLAASCAEFRRTLELFEQLDTIRGLKEKRAFVKRYKSTTGKPIHDTFNVNYSGQIDWGEVGAYVDSYYIICDGHLLLEVTAKGDEIYLSVMQLLKKDRYILALQEVLKELDIPYEVTGPMPKRVVSHALPTA